MPSVPGALVGPIPAKSLPVAAHTMRGVAMVLAAAMLWGTAGVAQSLAPPQLSSYWVGTLRLIVAAVFFLPWLLLTERAAFARQAIRSVPWRATLVAAACMVAFNLAFFAGVRSCGVAVGTGIALGSGPVWAGLLQALAGGRFPPPNWWLGTCVAVAGVALMVDGPGTAGTSPPIGVGLCLFAGLAYAGYALVNKRMIFVAPPSTVNALVFSLAALLAIPFAVVFAGKPMIQSDEIAIVLWLGVMSTAVAYLLFSHGLRHISSVSAVTLGLANPVTAFVLAIAVVGERPGFAAFMGLIALLVGLAVVTRAELRDSKRARA